MKDRKWQPVFHFSFLKEKDFSEFLPIDGVWNYFQSFKRREDCKRSWLSGAHSCCACCADYFGSRLFPWALTHRVRLFLQKSLKTKGEDSKNNKHAKYLDMLLTSIEIYTERNKYTKANNLAEKSFDYVAQIFKTIFFFFGLPVGHSKLSRCVWIFIKSSLGYFYTLAD